MTEQNRGVGLEQLHDDPPTEAAEVVQATKRLGVPVREPVRLRLFRAEAEPLLDFYRKQGILTTVDAAQPIDAVTAAILDALEGGGLRR